MNEWRNDPERITYLAATHTRGKNTAFGIRAKDRDKHMYILGKSGMGKSTLLENMAIQDIQNGEGMIFIDPHGSTAEKILDFIPQDRIKDVMYFAPFDTEHPIGFNILEDVGYDNRHKVVAGLMGVFERIWADAWSARMQYILQNTLFALLEYPGATIIDVNRMLVNKAFREDVISHVTDPIVAMFWKEEFAGYSDKYTQDATPAIQNKIGQFVSNPLIRNILGQAKSTFDFRKMMDERKVIIVNLSKGRMGEANAALLGSMLVIKVYLSALSRAEESAVSMSKLPNCYFYVDEFQNVTNKAFENILSEARKYKLCLTIANQYIEQMEEEVRNAVFGNVGTTIIFRVGPMDAQFLEPVFTPTFMPEDMVGLGRGDIYLTLMIDGVGSQPFSAHTLPPVEEPSFSFKDDIITWTQTRYGRIRADVEREVNEAGERWQSAAKEKHKTDSAKGQQKSAAPSYGTRPRPEDAAKPTVAPSTAPAPVEPTEPPATARREPAHAQRAGGPPAPAPAHQTPAEVLRAMHPVREDSRTRLFSNGAGPHEPRRLHPHEPTHRPPITNSPSDMGKDALKAAIASVRSTPPQPTSQTARTNQQHSAHHQNAPRQNHQQSNSHRDQQQKSQQHPNQQRSPHAPPLSTHEPQTPTSQRTNLQGSPQVDSDALRAVLYGDDEQTLD